MERKQRRERRVGGEKTKREKGGEKTEKGERGEGRKQRREKRVEWGKTKNGKEESGEYKIAGREEGEKISGTGRVRKERGNKSQKRNKMERYGGWRRGEG